MVKISRLDDSAEDNARGLVLVQEYCKATAAEMGLSLDELIAIMPDYNDFPARYRERGAFLVAEIDGEAAGCVGVARLSEAECEMNRMWIRPFYQGRGLGRKLAMASLKEGIKLGYSVMVLEVLPSRPKAIALYVSMGFFKREQVHHYDFPVVAYQRNLV